MDGWLLKHLPLVFVDVGCNGLHLPKRLSAGIIKVIKSTSVSQSVSQSVPHINHMERDRKHMHVSEVRARLLALVWAAAGGLPPCF